jgi:hypothetical protein
MKAAKLVTGSISILVFGIGIAFAFVDGASSNQIDVTADTLSTSVIVLPFAAAFVLAGIVSIARRNHQGSDVTVAVLYWLAALIGLAGVTADGNVVIWAVPLMVWALAAGLLGFVLTLPAGPARAR